MPHFQVDSLYAIKTEKVTKFIIFYSFFGVNGIEFEVFYVILQVFIDKLIEKMTCHQRLCIFNL